jgi:hypothetical protein
MSEKILPDDVRNFILEHIDSGVPTHWLGTSEFEPLYYLPRLATFGLIVIAAVKMNRTNTNRY